MKKVYFLCNGKTDLKRKWGSPINGIVEKFFNDKNYDVTSFYLNEELKKNHLHKTDQKKQEIIIKLNFIEKLISWFLNLICIFHFIEKIKFNSFLKNFEKPDVIVCMNTFSGYLVKNIKCKKIIFVGERQSLLYKNQIINRIKENYISGIFFLLKNIGFFIFADTSNIKLYKKFKHVFFWSYHDFLFFKKKISSNNIEYIANPIINITNKKLSDKFESKENKFFLEKLTKEKDKSNIVIIGHLKATHQIEGLIYFFNKVKRELLNINIWDKLNIFIIGKFEPNQYLKKISNYQNVYFTGFVDDISIFYRFADCNLVVSTPNLGNRSRIADFWINKTPVVARLDNINFPQIIHEYNALIGNNPNLIASHIKEVTTNKFLKNKIITNGYTTAINSFGLDQFKMKLDRIININI